MIANKKSTLYMLFCHQTFFLKITLITLFLMIYLVYILIYFLIRIEQRPCFLIFVCLFIYWLIIKYFAFSVLMSVCFSVSDFAFLFSTFLLLAFYSLCVVNLIINFNLVIFSLLSTIISYNLLFHFFICLLGENSKHGKENSKHGEFKTSEWESLPQTRYQFFIRRRIVFSKTRLN